MTNNNVMFDWIFFAIVGLPAFFVLLDWLIDPVSAFSKGRGAQRPEDAR